MASLTWVAGIRVRLRIKIQVYQVKVCPPQFSVRLLRCPGLEMIGTTKRRATFHNFMKLVQKLLDAFVVHGRGGKTTFRERLTRVFGHWGKHSFIFTLDLLRPVQFPAARATRSTMPKRPFINAGIQLVGLTPSARVRVCHAILIQSQNILVGLSVSCPFGPSLPGGTVVTTTLWRAVLQNLGEKRTERGLFIFGNRGFYVCFVCFVYFVSFVCFVP
jgi:hypothetical protein